MTAATKDSFAQAVEALARKFDADRETYLSPGYGEAQARGHFITPFFNALGWDMANELSFPTVREVDVNFSGKRQLL